MFAHSRGQKGFSGKWYAEMLIENTGNYLFRVGLFSLETGVIAEAANIELWFRPDFAGGYDLSVSTLKDYSGFTLTPTGINIPFSSFPIKVFVAADHDLGQATVGYCNSLTDTIPIPYWIDMFGFGGAPFHSAQPMTFTVGDQKNVVIVNGGSNNQYTGPCVFTLLTSDQHQFMPSGFQPWTQIDQ